MKKILLALILTPSLAKAFLLDSQKNSPILEGLLTSIMSSSNHAPPIPNTPYRANKKQIYIDGSGRYPEIYPETVNILMPNGIQSTSQGKSVSFVYKLSFDCSSSQLCSLINSAGMSVDQFIKEHLSLNLSRNGIPLNIDKIDIGIPVPNLIGSTINSQTYLPVKDKAHTQIKLTINYYPYDFETSVDSADEFTLSVQTKNISLPYNIFSIGNLPNKFKVFFYNPQNMNGNLTQNTPSNNSTSQFVFYQANTISPDIYLNTNIKYTIHKENPLEDNSFRLSHLETAISSIESCLQNNGFPQTYFTRVYDDNDASIIYTLSQAPDSVSGQGKKIFLGANLLPNVNRTTLHETGHKLGLSHQFNSINSVMNYADNEKMCYTPFDLNSLRHIYQGHPSH